MKNKFIKKKNEEEEEEGERIACQLTCLVRMVSSVCSKFNSLAFYQKLFLKEKTL